MYGNRGPVSFMMTLLSQNGYVFIVSNFLTTYLYPSSDTVTNSFSCTGSPSLYHVTSGRGRPSGLQTNVLLSPHVMLASVCLSTHRGGINASNNINNDINNNINNNINSVILTVTSKLQSTVSYNLFQKHQQGLICSYKN